ncbi:MAG: ABC transporter substrate-binding protein [Oscillospiraceae bacterium]|jgi:peptide/nickel transport system substrate-binding protein|nr:ABC transporter substrate-binding protein [Oscillospiraceae bacterium]
MLLKRIVAAVSAIILTASCAAGCETVEDTPEQPVASPPDATEEAPVYTPAAVTDGRFTLKYDPDSTLNPMTGTDADNMLVASLMYEGLFALDEGFSPVPVLCESYATEDALTYVFTIKQDVAMGDGTYLTADDVAYSLDLARSLPKFAGRLDNIDGVAADDSDDNDNGSVEVRLKRADGNLPALLDIPIIKSGGAERFAPAGSGPYVYTERNGEPLLAALQRHADSSRLPFRDIYLAECAGSELVELFTDGKIDLYRTDPTGLESIETHWDHEIRYYNTTTLQYLGFSKRQPILSVPEMRQAIGLCADREGIVGDVMSGAALPAPLLLSPAYGIYDSGWEGPTSDAFLEISSIFSRLGLSDYDSDLFLEYPMFGGGYAAFSLDFIVNSENQRKAEAARSICDTITRMGIDARLRVLPWDEFAAALEEGDFDIYYGETSIPANFDVSELLLSGGKLDYGGAGSQEYAAFIDSFLASGSEAQRAAAARRLCDQVRSDAIVVPILYKQYTIHSGRNIISGMRPTQTSVFFGMTDWSVGEIFFTGGAYEQ